MTDPNPPWLDRPRAVRPGEELDLPALAAFLRAHIDGLGGELEVEQFPGGHSNLTYLLRFRERELVLRRPPAGAKGIKHGHDMGREFRVLGALHRVWPKVPRPLAFSEENDSPLGIAFFVMERVRGVILRSASARGVTLDPPTMRRVCEAFVDNLVELHAIDVQRAQLADLGRPDGYVERQISGWTERWRKARTDGVPDLDRTAEYLATHVPPATAPTLVHNDYKLDNLVLDPDDLGRVRAVLDWEMATVGDPLSDLGMSLAYWIDADDAPELRALQVGHPLLPGNLTRAEIAARYAQKSGRDVARLAYFRVLGLFKVAVIAQQIYARYAAGLTKDERFARMLDAVRVLGRTAIVASRSGSLS